MADAGWWCGAPTTELQAAGGGGLVWLERRWFAKGRWVRKENARVEVNGWACASEGEVVALSAGGEGGEPA